MSEVLKIYECSKFKGHYPVGTSAIIVAYNIHQAARMLEERLEKAGIPQKIHAERLTVLPSHEPNCFILQDGDY